MPTDPDYYAALGVRPTVSPHDLKRQYRRLAKVYHPDRNPGEEEWCTEQLARVNEAFAVLSDPKLRAQYDRQREAAASPSSTPPAADTKRSTIVDAPPDPRAYEAYRSAAVRSAKRKSRRPILIRLIAVAALCALTVYGILWYISTPPDTPVPQVSNSTHARPVRVAGPVEIVHRRPVVRRIYRHPTAHYSAHHRHRHGLTSAQKDARALAIAERVEAAKRAKNGL